MLHATVRRTAQLIVSVLVLFGANQAGSVSAGSDVWTGDGPSSPHSSVYRIFLPLLVFQTPSTPSFTRITTGAIVNDGGNSSGACWGDYDNDGYDDLFVANWAGENNFLYHNNGDGAFTRIATGGIVNDGGWSRSCTGATMTTMGSSTSSSAKTAVVTSYTTTKAAHLLPECFPARSPAMTATVTALPGQTTTTMAGSTCSWPGTPMTTISSITIVEMGLLTRLPQAGQCPTTAATRSRPDGATTIRMGA